MNFNFADLKKEAAASGEDVFNSGDPAKQAAAMTPHDLQKEAAEAAAASEAVFSKTDPAKQAAKMIPQEMFDGGAETSPGRQDDNAHTEQYFGNEKRELGFEHVDPQAFVQRMSAGAKEAQEQLDAKFAQYPSDLDVLLGDASKNVGEFGTQLHQDAKRGVVSLTKDFMNVERGMFGGAGDVSTDKATPLAAVPAVAPAVFEEDLLGVGDGHFAPTAPVAPSSNFAGNDFTASASNKDSDTDSPSVSYNPSPIKKLPIADALKEQDHEKFISSEDLLGDFKDERTATPDFKPASAATTTTSVTASAKPTSVPTTDLDAEEDDDEGFMFTTIATPFSHAENVKDVQPAAVAVASRVAPAAPAAAASKPAAASEPAPAKIETQTVKDIKPAPVVAKNNKANEQNKAEHPNIISVEEIFYKYGLDAWFKPERLHPRVESLIYWRDVKKSGIVFGAGLVILLAISCFSVISVFAYLSLLTLVGTVAFRIYKSIMQAVQKTSDGHPFKEYLEIDLALSQEKVQNVAGVAVAHVNGFTAELRRLFLVEDLVDSIKFGVILWVMTYLGAWFNGMTLVILTFVSLFTLPKVYENNKQSIDTYLDLVRSKLTEITDKIKTAIPIGKKPIVAEADKDK